MRYFDTACSKGRNIFSSTGADASLCSVDRMIEGDTRDCYA